MPEQTPLDPLDAGDPHRKAWEEFRVGFSGALLQVWLLGEIHRIAPDYFANLQTRLEKAFDHAELLAREDPDYDGAVPLDADSNPVIWYDRDEAEELYDQLFPHGPPSMQDQTTGLGLAVVGLHSAFEAYASAIGAFRRGSLPRAVVRYIHERRTTLDSRLADGLTECDATRHLIVHNRGIVDERYVETVKDNRLRPGERRPLSFVLVSDFANALWRTARQLRELSAPPR
jgi:hypothetical protein